MCYSLPSWGQYIGGGMRNSYFGCHQPGRKFLNGESRYRCSVIGTDSSWTLDLGRIAAAKGAIVGLVLNRNGIIGTTRVFYLSPTKVTEIVKKNLSSTRWTEVYCLRTIIEKVDESERDWRWSWSTTRGRNDSFGIPLTTSSERFRSTNKRYNAYPPANHVLRKIADADTVSISVKNLAGNPKLFHGC